MRIRDLPKTRWIRTGLQRPLPGGICLDAHVQRQSKVKAAKSHEFR